MLIKNVFCQVRGHPFMTSTQNRVFDPHCPHMRLHELDPWGRPCTCGRHEIHIALFKRL